MLLTGRPLVWVICLNLIGTACSVPLASPAQTNSLSRQQVVDIVWQALEPNTSSHQRAAWEDRLVQSVTGRDIQDKFQGGSVPGGCAPGPKPPDNAPFALDATYWYVRMQPRAATSQPSPTNSNSPTAPPNVPEPFVYQADFLIDASSGRIAARKLYCVIY